MATSSFERKIQLNSPNAIRRFARVMNQQNAKINKVPAYTTEERNRSEALLKQLLSRSKQS